MTDQFAGHRCQPHNLPLNGPQSCLICDPDKGQAKPKEVQVPAGWTDHDDARLDELLAGGGDTWLDRVCRRVRELELQLNGETQMPVMTLLEKLDELARINSSSTGGQLAIETAVRIRELERQRDAWEETAKQHLRNEEFWRSLVHKTGTILGGRVYVQDDGGVVDEPLGLRVPEVAAEMVNQRDALRAALKETIAAVDEACTATGYFKVAKTSEQRLRIEATIAQTEPRT